MFRDQVDGLLAALFRRQSITGTAQEYPGGCGADPHRTGTGRTDNRGNDHRVRTHTAFFRLFARVIQLFAEISKEFIQHRFPFRFIVGDMVELVFHPCGKVVVHQFRKGFFETIGDNFTHFLSIETAVFHFHITAILNGGNN